MPYKQDQDEYLTLLITMVRLLNWARGNTFHTQPQEAKDTLKYKIMAIGNKLKITIL